MDFSEELTKYNKKQADFILAMLEYDNIKKSAEIARITEATAFKYLKNGLRSEIDKFRKQWIESKLNQLEFASIKATNVLIEILEDNNCSKSVKLNASKTVLDYALKIREQTEIIERLEGIEKRVNERES